MYNSHLDIWTAGAFAAVIVDFVVYPFDTLKTRIQSPEYEKVFKDTRTGTLRRNVLFRGLYQGVWSVVLSTIPSSGAFFTTYEAVKCTLHNSSRKASSSSPSNSQYPSNPDSSIGVRLPFTHTLPSPIIHAIASSSAEMVACLMLTPAEVLKQNAQMVDSGSSPSSSSSSTSSSTSSTSSSSQNGNNKTAMSQVLSRFRSNPWRLWSGYTALVGRNLPFTGLQFPIFEYVRSHVSDWRRRRKEAVAAAAASSNSSVDNGGNAGESDKCGGGGGTPPTQSQQLLERATLTGLSASISGTIASIVTTPIDVIKTRMMLSASEGNSSSFSSSSPVIKHLKQKTHKGTLAVGRDIFRHEGVRGLFKGGALRAGWTAVSLSMYLSLYEGARFYLETRRRLRQGVEIRSKEEGEVPM